MKHFPYKSIFELSRASSMHKNRISVDGDYRSYGINNGEHYFALTYHCPFSVSRAARAHDSYLSYEEFNNLYSLFV